MRQRFSHAGLVNCHGRFSICLCGIEPFISSLDHGLRRITNLVLSPPVVKEQRDLFLIQDQYNRTHARPDQLNLSRLTVRKNHKELIAPHSYKDIASAKGSLQAARKLFQRQVASGMTMFVVKLFKPVEVDRE